MLSSLSHLSGGITSLTSLHALHHHRIRSTNPSPFTPIPRTHPTQHKQIIAASHSSHKIPQNTKKSPQKQSNHRHTTSFYQTQLDNAIKYKDIEACIYLFTHHGSQEHLSITSPQLQSIINACFYLKQHDDVIALLRSIPSPKATHFSTAMKECLKKKDIVMLDRVIALREKAGFLPDAYSASARIAALGAASDSTAALSALRTAWNTPACRTIEVCNAAIGACAAAGDWPSAEAAFRFITDNGLSPDIVSYNSLIKAAGTAGLMSKVISLYEELQQHSNNNDNSTSDNNNDNNSISHNLSSRTYILKPTPQTYTVLFTAAARNEFSDADWLLSVFQSITVELNDFILSSFISALSFAPCTRPHFDAVFAALADTRVKSPLNDTTYTALLVFLTRQKIAERTVDVWGAALQDNVPLSPHFFSALFSACAAGSSPALIDVAFDAYSALRDWWSEQDKRRIPAWMEHDVRVAYNSLLHFVGDLRRTDEALGVFEDMKRQGPLPDTVTYNTIIHAVGSAGDADMALSLFAEMNSSGIETTVRTFGALLHAFATVGDADGAHRVFRSLKSKGIEPNEVLYTSFIDALVKSGDTSSLSVAFDLFEEMKAQGLQPTVVTYGCLLVACERLGDVSRAFVLYSGACAEGIVPSDEMHNILIGVCTKGGRLDDALDLVKRMARKHAQLQQQTLNSLIRALSPSFPGRALRMLSLMQTMNMQPTRKTYLALVTGCAKASDGHVALALYRKMRAQGMEADGLAGSALIACLCQAQRLNDAVAVYEEMMALAWRRDDPAIRHRRPPLQLDNSNTNNNNSNNNNTNRRVNTRKGALSKRAQVPSSAALAWLAQSHAAAGQLRAAWRFYKQLRRSSVGMQDATVTHRRLFEALIEGNCRQKMVKRALIVFDDWKSASGRWFVQHDHAMKGDSSSMLSINSNNGNGSNYKNSSDGKSIATTSSNTNTTTVSSSSSSSSPMTITSSSSSSTTTTVRTPKLSNVSLAFLEACCRSEPELQWRVYDVFSVMRMQKERKLQATLDRPQKISHHVLGSVQMN